MSELKNIRNTMWTIGYIDRIEGDELFIVYEYQNTMHFICSSAKIYREKQIVGIHLQEAIVNQFAEHEIIDICEYSMLDISNVHIFYDYQRVLINIASENYQTSDFIRNIESQKVSKFLLRQQVLTKILNIDFGFISEYVRNTSIEHLLDRREVHLYEHTNHSTDNTEDWTEIICTDYEDSYLNSLLQIKGSYSYIGVNNTPKLLPGETYVQAVDRVIHNSKVNAIKQYSQYVHMQVLLHECSVILSEYHASRCSVLERAKNYLGYEI